MNILVWYFAGMPLGLLAMAWRRWRYRAVHADSALAMSGANGHEWSRSFLANIYTYSFFVSIVEWPWTIVKFFRLWRRPIVEARQQAGVLRVEILP